MSGNTAVPPQQGSSMGGMGSQPSFGNSAFAHQYSNSNRAYLVWDLISAGGPQASYFRWENWIYRYRQHSLWHVPISVQNNPGFAAFVSNLNDHALAWFRRVFSGDPWGEMSDSLSATDRRKWYQEATTSRLRDMFLQIISYRAANIQTSPPDRELHGVYITRFHGEASMMLHEALEAIEPRYQTRYIFDPRLPSFEIGGFSASGPLPTSYSAPSLQSRVNLVNRGYTASDAIDVDSYFDSNPSNTYCLRFCFFIFLASSNVNVSQILQRWRRFRSQGRGQDQPGQALRQLSR